MRPATSARRPAMARVLVDSDRQPPSNKTPSAPQPLARATARAARGWAATLGPPDGSVAAPLAAFLASFLEPFLALSAFLDAAASVAIVLLPQATVAFGALALEDESDQASAIEVLDLVEDCRSAPLAVDA